jgi:GABA(A) receptor-associated protein
MSFRDGTSFNDRLNKSRKIIKQFPDRIPIICEISTVSNNNYPKLDKNKYLVPSNFTLGQFIFIIRKRLELPPEKAIFLFINDQIYNSTKILSNIYEFNKDQDGFLYITYTFENTFGDHTI